MPSFTPPVQPEDEILTDSAQILQTARESKSMPLI